MDTSVFRIEFHAFCTGHCEMIIALTLLSNLLCSANKSYLDRTVYKFKDTLVLDFNDAPSQNAG